MGPHSRSRSINQHCRYSKTPERRKGRREHDYDSRSRSVSRSTDSPSHLPSSYTGRVKHYDDEKKCSYRSVSPQHYKRRKSPSYRSRSNSRSRTHRCPCDKRPNTREWPMQSRCIGIFGLNVYTTQQQIREIFAKYGPIERIQVVIDAKTGLSRGFCFIYYEDLSDAKAAKEASSGMEIDGRRIRVDYSITQRPHTPTPGIYMGRPTKYRQRGYHDRYREEYRARRRTPSESPSRYEGRSSTRGSYRTERRSCRYERSKSRSYTPPRRQRH